MTKSPTTLAIEAALIERYACMAYPTGALTDIAAEFGVGRSRVGLIAGNLGMTGPGSGRRQVRPKRYCASCGALVTGNATYCMDCRTVTLPCAQCGEPVKRSAALLAARVGGAESERRRANGLPAYTGNVFCDRACSARYAVTRRKH